MPVIIGSRQHIPPEILERIAEGILITDEISHDDMLRRAKELADRFTQKDAYIKPDTSKYNKRLDPKNRKR
jgi:hypothetical protein